MEGSDLWRIFCKPDCERVCTAPFINELEIMKKCYAPDFHDHGVIFTTEYNARQKMFNDAKGAALSTELREKGNWLMRNKSDGIHEAAQTYTEAILKAPLESECLGLAHANRSLALKKLGYLEAAYDDCEYALERNYPTALQHKLVFRQAEICKELGELEKLKEHINQLEKMELGDAFKKALDSLKVEAGNIITKPFKELQTALETTESFEEPVQVVNPPSQSEPSLIATKPIKPGDTVFTDEAFIIFPFKGTQMCHNCGDFLIVPFPCLRCNGNVLYCSRKCQKEHFGLHKYECLFEEIEFQDMKVSLNLIYLRLLLKGLPQILPILKDQPDADALWSECFNKNNDLVYLTILRAQSFWAKANEEMMIYMEVAKEIITYIERFSNFFDQFDGTSASKREWKIFMSALLLRHMGQRKQCLGLFKNFLEPYINLLSPKVARGELNSHASGNKVISFGFYVFPKLSTCKHDCSEILRTKIEGLKVTATAMKDISMGSDIKHNFLDEYPAEYSTPDRLENMQTLWFFKCECLACKTGKDEEFRAAYRFLCQNPRCKKYFSFKDRLENQNIICEHCKHDQNFKLEQEMNGMFQLSVSSNTRQRIFTRLRWLDKLFYGYNLLKFQIFCLAVLVCLKSHKTISPLSMSELEQVHEIISQAIDIVEHNKCHPVRKMFMVSLLWDFIALKNKPINKSVLRNTLEWVKDEIPSKQYSFCMKYYSDYIAPLIKND